ncbi:uncharacterized protein F5147DRAFT_773621 [Suillus discolor]|uniref:Uncharacterized protein n=1 Tax=Suillus discolor TaxID=1912936 RepID=A0A9P7F6V3_9AGAM|nr:uncharacterized protein F5147DRAFT_773621 [Suillus discolor]KAG2108417.1 hypothetical protein F5147DRAFT_773621 [Suillus discolor]
MFSLSVPTCYRSPSITLLIRLSQLIRRAYATTLTKRSDPSRLPILSHLYTYQSYLRYAISFVRMWCALRVIYIDIVLSLQFFRLRLKLKGPLASSIITPFASTDVNQPPRLLAGEVIYILCLCRMQQRPTRIRFPQVLKLTIEGPSLHVYRDLGLFRTPSEGVSRGPCISILNLDIKIGPSEP